MYFTQDNITFQNVQLINIDAWNTEVIFATSGSNSTFKNLTSTGCNAQDDILAISGQNQYPNASTAVINSSFSNATCEAISVVDCRTRIVNSTFNSISVPAGSGGAIWVNNTDLSDLNVTGCNFTDNAVSKK